MKHLLATILLVSCAGLATSCSSSTAADEALSLLGQWEIEEARRNGRPTESLTGLYFVFTPEGNFKTNMSGMPEEGTYTLDESKIITEQVQLPLTYNILTLNDSTLVLQSTYQHYRFDFNLRRSADQNADISS